MIFEQFSSTANSAAYTQFPSTIHAIEANSSEIEFCRGLESIRIGTGIGIDRPSGDSWVIMNKSDWRLTMCELIGSDSRHGCL